MRPPDRRRSLVPDVHSVVHVCAETVESPHPSRPTQQRPCRVRVASVAVRSLTCPWTREAAEISRDLSVTGFDHGAPWVSGSESPARSSCRSDRDGWATPRGRWPTPRSGQPQRPRERQTLLVSLPPGVPPRSRSGVVPLVGPALGKRPERLRPVGRGADGGTPCRGRPLRPPHGTRPARPPCTGTLDSGRTRDAGAGEVGAGDAAACVNAGCGPVRPVHAVRSRRPAHRPDHPADTGEGLPLADRRRSRPGGDGDAALEPVPGRHLRAGRRGRGDDRTSSSFCWVTRSPGTSAARSCPSFSAPARTASLSCSTS